MLNQVSATCSCEIPDTLHILLKTFTKLRYRYENVENNKIRHAGTNV